MRGKAADTFWAVVSVPLNIFIGIMNIVGLCRWKMKVEKGGKSAVD